MPRPDRRRCILGASSMVFVGVFFGYQIATVHFENQFNLKHLRLSSSPSGNENLVRNESSIAKPTDDAVPTCNRLWRKGKSVWFDEKFDRNLSGLLTERNKDLKPEVFKWWIHLQKNDDPDYRAALHKVFQIISRRDPYFPKTLTKCLKCAVVGNSGNLKKSAYGPIIDSHEFVLRINNAPTHHFETDVGTKTTHRFMYPESYSDISQNTSFVLLNFKVLDIAWLASALSTGNITKTYTSVKRIIGANKEKVMIYNPALMFAIQDQWMKNHGRYPSSGMLAVFFALQTCDEVDLYGFGGTEMGNWDHYWEKNDGLFNSFFKATGVHDSEYEKYLLMRLEEDGKVRIFKGHREPWSPPKAKQAKEKKTS